MSGLKAALPMYDFPALRPSWDGLWQEMRARLVEAGFRAPAGLTWDRPPAVMWRDPALILGQTCSLPWRRGLRDFLTVIGAFDFGLKGCPPGYYNSVIVVPKASRARAAAELEDARAAVNALDSQSGHAALADWLGEAPEAPVLTGAHLGSIRALAEGRADVAAIDAQSWEILRREPPARALREIARTRPTPGLPLVTAERRQAAAVADAVAFAVARAPTRVLRPLGIRGFVRFGDADYADPARF